MTSQQNLELRVAQLEARLEELIAINERLAIVTEKILTGQSPVVIANTKS